MGLTSHDLNVGVPNVCDTSDPETTNHGFLCIYPYKILGWCVWVLPRGPPAQSISGVVQGSPILLTKAVATQGHPEVPIHAFPLALGAPTEGRKKGERGRACEAGALIVLH